MLKRLNSLIANALQPIGIPMVQKSIETTDRWSLLWRQIWHHLSTCRVHASILVGTVQRWHKSYLISMLIRQTLSKYFNFITRDWSLFIHGKLDRRSHRQRNTIISVIPERHSKWPAIAIAILPSSMTSNVRCGSRWWLQTWDTCLSMAVLAKQ